MKNREQIESLLEAGWLPPIVAPEAGGLRLDTLTPLGKVAAIVPRDDPTGDAVTDYQLRAMLWTIVAEAEKATRS